MCPHRRPSGARRAPLWCCRRSSRCCRLSREQTRTRASSPFRCACCPLCLLVPVLGCASMRTGCDSWLTQHAQSAMQRGGFGCTRQGVAVLWQRTALRLRAAGEVCSLPMPQPPACQSSFRPLHPPRLPALRRPGSRTCSSWGSARRASTSRRLWSAPASCGRAANGSTVRAQRIFGIRVGLAVESQPYQTASCGRAASGSTARVLEACGRGSGQVELWCVSSHVERSNASLTSCCSAVLASTPCWQSTTCAAHTLLPHPRATHTPSAVDGEQDWKQ